MTLVGCAFAAVLVGLCVWMALDLATTMATLKPSFWSWLITADGAVDLQVGQAFVNLTRSLAAFLGLVIALEIAILVYVHRKIDVLAEEILDSLGS